MEGGLWGEIFDTRIVPRRWKISRVLGECLVVYAHYLPTTFIFSGYNLHISCQIIATSHDLTRNGGLVRETPCFRES